MRGRHAALAVYRPPDRAEAGERALGSVRGMFIKEEVLEGSKRRQSATRA